MLNANEVLIIPSCFGYQWIWTIRILWPYPESFFHRGCYYSSLQNWRVRKTEVEWGSYFQRDHNCLLLPSFKLVPLICHILHFSNHFHLTLFPQNCICDASVTLSWSSLTFFSLILLLFVSITRCFFIKFNKWKLKPFTLFFFPFLSRFGLQNLLLLYSLFLHIFTSNEIRNCHQLIDMFGILFGWSKASKW